MIAQNTSVLRQLFPALLALVGTATTFVATATPVRAADASSYYTVTLAAPVAKPAKLMLGDVLWNCSGAAAARPLRIPPARWWSAPSSLPKSARSTALPRPRVNSPPKTWRAATPRSPDSFSNRLFSARSFAHTRQACPALSGCGSVPRTDRSRLFLCRRAGCARLCLRHDPDHDCCAHDGCAPSSRLPA